MQNKFAEVSARNFNPMSVTGLSDEARKAVNAAFDAMSTWRIETAKNSEKNSEQVIEKMAAAARALGWPEQIVDATRATNAEHHQNADPNDGSRDGRLGGADKITAPDDRLPIGDAVETKVSAKLRPGRRLAKRRRLPNGDGEPLPVLDTNGGAVAESLGRRDGALGQGWQAT